MTRQINGIVVDARLGDETVRSQNFYVLSLLLTHAATAASNTPDTTPDADTLYLVGTSPTGLWAGHANNLAYWYKGAWQFIVPKVGLTINGNAWNGTSWGSV